MIKTIKYHPKFFKNCDKLKKANDKAKKAVKKAFEILEKISNSKKEFRHLGSLGQNGELRLKDCIKYRLGNGYRLVLLLDNEALLVLFIGSHDQCNQWLEINRGAKHFNFLPQKIVKAKTISIKEKSSPVLKRTEPDLTIPVVEDKILRKIFKGLCSTAN